MDDIDAHADAYAISERDINALGYQYLGRRAFENALAIFDFNVRRFPDSSNAYDSLAEAAATAGDEGRLERTLAAWLARSAGNTEVKSRVADIRALAARVQDERRHAYRPGQPTGIKGPYFGQTPPGTTPVLFAPGIVSLAGSNEGFCTMSPDGTEFFFAASGRVADVVVAPPPGKARFAAANPPVIMVSRLTPGGWTFPEQAAFTSGFAAREPHVSLDNKRLYWEWFRSVPAGESDPLNLGTGVWASERTATGWSVPAFVGQAMVVTTDEAGDVYVTDLSELATGAQHVAKAVLKDGKFSRLERVQGGFERFGKNTAHPVIAPDGSYLLFDTGGPPTQVCFRNADGTWGDPIDLSEHGLERGMTATSVSRDGNYLFFAKGGDIYWASATLVTALRPAAAK
jgi:hypothetical protein